MKDFSEIVKKYHIEIAGDNLKIHPSVRNSPADLDYIKTNKPGIMAYIREQKEQAERERQENIMKVNAIEGRDELSELEAAWELYYEANRRWIEDDCIGAEPVKPEKTVKEVADRYPRAAAYRHAEKFSLSDNFVKAGYGRRAMEQIRDGADYDQAVADMETAWTQYCDSHQWD